MSRRKLSFVALFLAAFAVTACADITAPAPVGCGGVVGGSGTC